MGATDRDGICFRNIAYEPLPSQRSFHDSPSRFKGFSGPIGSGKSQALCQEAIKLSYLNPGRTGLIGAPTYPMLRDATLAALFEILDGNRLPYDYNKSENVLVMRDTRSRMLFRPLDEYERLRGTNLAWFGLDELTYVQPEAWSRLEGRLRDPHSSRLCGFAVWTPKGYDWVYQKFISEAVEGYYAVIAKAFENRHLMIRVPDFYEQLKRSYDATFYEQEVLGQYLNLNGGLVYNAFSRNDHVTDVALEARVPLLWALDFNVDPMSSIVAQVVRGTVSVLGEIVIRHASTLQACEEFDRRFSQHGAGLVIYGDASGNARQTTGSTDYDIVREFFRTRYPSGVSYRVPRYNPHVRERILAVNAALRSAAGDIRLYVDRTCKELIKDLEQVSYKADSVDIDKDRDRRRTHLSDALGYLVWQERRPRPHAGEHGEGALT